MKSNPVIQTASTLHSISLIALVLMILVLPNFSRAQTSENTEEEIWTVCEVPPSFPGGISSLKQFLADNIVFQYLAPENERIGTVFVSVVVVKKRTVVKH